MLYGYSTDCIYYDNGIYVTKSVFVVAVQFILYLECGEKFNNVQSSSTYSIHKGGNKTTTTTQQQANKKPYKKQK